MCLAYFTKASPFNTLLRTMVQLGFTQVLPELKKFKNLHQLQAMFAGIQAKITIYLRAQWWLLTNHLQPFVNLLLDHGLPEQLPRPWRSWELFEHT